MNFSCLIGGISYHSGEGCVLSLQDSSLWYYEYIVLHFFQSPIEYDRLTVSKEYRDQTRDRVLGICFFNGRLYLLESLGYPEYTDIGHYRLTVYSDINKDKLRRLDTLEFEHQSRNPGEPRVDHLSGQVYIPCDDDVCVVRYDGGKLTRVRSLRCVRNPRHLAVVSTDALYVCDVPEKSVCLVDVNQDRVTARLDAPREINSYPYGVAIVGDTILVSFRDLSSESRLVIYRHGIPTPGKLVLQPPGLTYLGSLSTDNHISFLVADQRSKVYVLDLSGKVIHTIGLPEHSEPRDCTVIGGQLWVGCREGHIMVMSPQVRGVQSIDNS